MLVLSKDEIINLLKKGSCNLSNEQIIEFIEEQERLRIAACDELYEEMVERQKAEVRIEKELGLKKLAKKEKEIEELKTSLRIQEPPYQIGDEVYFIKRQTKRFKKDKIYKGKVIGLNYRITNTNTSYWEIQIFYYDENNQSLIIDPTYQNFVYRTEKEAQKELEKGGKNEFRKSN